MADIIQLLPDNIANQIAAGEVIQRPASAVKELLENAIDAGATQIHLIIKDAGKELIQVIDNGKGMSDTDARMSFERHATSKIRTIDDLFTIRTMGFRGEALASIAAVALVELKSRQSQNDAGTFIKIDNSIVRLQEPVGCPIGTSIAIKNLFFNVPARRNFLKSNTTEVRHIVDEFTRVAMAFPEIAFRFTNNDADIFVLEAGNLKQRILGLLGNNLNNKLVSLEENTEYVKISGFIGTPDAASRTRGHQFIFVNNRFVKSAYLNHAINQAYDQLIAKEDFPLFVLFINIDPAKIDVNVHPTKQEIKFDDEKIIYAYINSAIKHALSKNSIAPSLDFDLDTNITHLASITQPYSDNTKAQVQTDYLFNSFTQKGQAHFIEKKESAAGWRNLYDAPSTAQQPNDIQPFMPAEQGLYQDATSTIQLFQLQNKYILYPKSKGFLLIAQHAATERLIYDELCEKQTNKSVEIQSSLNPIVMELNTADAVILGEILDDLKVLGYWVEAFGNNTFIIQGIPAGVKPGMEKEDIEKIIEDYKFSGKADKTPKAEKVLRSIAHNKALSVVNKTMTQHEMNQLCDKLFRSIQPMYTPSGQKIFTEITYEEIEKLLAK